MMLFLPERVHTGLPLALGIAAHPSSFTSQSGSERASADSRFVVGLYGAIRGLPYMTSAVDGEEGPQKADERNKIC